VDVPLVGRHVIKHGKNLKLKIYVSGKIEFFFLNVRVVDVPLVGRHVVNETKIV
jgi:hypothetical protein